MPALSASAALPPALAARPLVVTGDAVLLDELLRLTAAAGADAEVAADPGAARSGWVGAPLVLVGGDLADGVAALVATGFLPRRAAVVIVTADLDDAGVWQRAVAVGAEHVACLPDAEPWLIDRLGAAADGPGAGGLVLGVLGGRGGAGATVLAAALALAGLRAGLRTMLVDADPLGGGIDLVLGAEQQVGVRWSGLTGLRGRLPAGALHEALPAVGELTVLSWDGPPEVGAGATEAAMSALLTAARAGSDLVVVDLPRHLDEAARTALAAASRVLLVVPAELRACSAAARVLAGIRDRADIGLVVRRGAGRLPDTVVAEALGLPLIGALRPEPGLADCLERGEPPGRGPGPLARLCDRVVADLTAAGRRG